MSDGCSDCFTRIEFKENIVNISFDVVEEVLTSKKSSICMFMVDDYMFEFIDYVKDEDENEQQIIGCYITPIPHLNFMNDEEIWFKLNKNTVNKFTFFDKKELVITIHGMLFHNGEFKENLTNRFPLSEIREITNDVWRYVMKYCSDKKRGTTVQNVFKCIGVHS